MNTSKVQCCYCLQPRECSPDLHGCEQSLEAQAYIATLMDSMTAMAAGEIPTSKPWNTDRPQQFRSMATGILISGGEVRPREN